MRKQGEGTLQHQILFKVEEVQGLERSPKFAS